MRTGPVRPSRVEVDLGAIRHNVVTLRAAVAVADAAVCVVVKADGYGHGAVAVARAAVEAGATWLAVALVEEGEELRAAGITVPVLLLYEPPAAAASRVLAAGLVPSVATPAFGDALDAVARHLGPARPVHLCFDTGMGRSGAPPSAWGDLVAAAGRWEGLEVDGVWSHLARADEPDQPTTATQRERFDDVLARVHDAGLSPTWVHLANSAGALLHPSTAHALVRVGIAAYGLSPAPDVRARDHGLRQAVRLVTEVAMVKHLAAGTPVSYGHSWSAPSDGWLATIPIGYADGVLRGLTNRAEVLVDGRRMPLVGNVTMDQCLVWCGDHQPSAGDEVVLLGGQGDEWVDVDEWAELLDTISYEITCTLGPRLPRVHHG